MEIIAPDISQLESITQNDVLLRLYRYWLDKRSDRPCPSRSDIDPLEFSFAFNWVSLVDVLKEPRRFRYRLVASQLTERLGYEMTGKYVDEIPDDDVRGYVDDLYTRTVELAAPLYENSTRTFDQQIWQYEALVLPLSSDGTAVDMIMVYRITEKPRPVC